MVPRIKESRGNPGPPPCGVLLEGEAHGGPILLQRLPAPEKTHVLVKEEDGAKGRFSWTNKTRSATRSVSGGACEGVWH